jgi:C1A family cysteine protease
MFFYKFLFYTLCLSSFVNASLLERFKEWTLEFKIIIENDKHEYNIFQKWIENDEYIKKFNSNINNTFSLGHNHFSGMDSNDFKEYLGFNNDNTFLNKKINQKYEINNNVNLPSSVNWVEKGGVTPVKDQGQCGSCWSFSTTGSLEGAYYNKYGTLESFSEQQLVDCDNLRNGGKDHGCKGGLMDNAFSWIDGNNGLCTEKDYPYVSGVTKSAGSCNNNCVTVKGSDIVNFVDVLPNSDDAMMQALVMQPVSIAIEADQKEFQLYKYGVFTSNCGTNLDHGVLVVGYGTNENGIDYYIVKNSWSSSWGSNGYIYLGRGKQYNDGNGQCGMLMQGSYPII